MKTVKLHIEGDFDDGYFYGGQLFLINSEGCLSSFSMSSILSNNFSNKEELNFAKLVFSQNNWMNNSQIKVFNSLSDFKKVFKAYWIKFSTSEFSIKIGDKSGNLLSELSSNINFDFKVYGMRLFIGNASGLYESGFTINNNDTVKLNDKIEKVFDSRIVNITAKYGSLALSSNDDGLFHAHLYKPNERVSVNFSPIKSYSLRTCWTGHDLINYENNVGFDYLINKHSKRNKEEIIRYVFKDEAEDKKIQIDKIGVSIYNGLQLISECNIPEDDVRYTYNTNDNCFLLMKDGNIKYMSFIKNQASLINLKKEVKLSSKVLTFPKKLSRKVASEKPISIHTVFNATIIEYFDKVIMFRDGEIQILENRPVLSIKTFPSSVRYRNLVMIFNEGGVRIHSLFPENWN